MNRVTALFPDHNRAQDAVDRLRSAGIMDSKLSSLGPNGEVSNDTNPVAADADVTNGATRGLAVGASAGALFGIAAALIPGVGPFITAGVLASSLGAVAGGAVAGAVVGGTAGTLAGALTEAGYDADEAGYYGNAVHNGSYMVAVDAADDAQASRVRGILDSSNANYYDRTAGNTVNRDTTGSGMMR